MSDAASGKNPPKPRFALSIGVVGHKPDRIAKDPETLAKRKAAIRAKVDEVLAAIARTAEAVRKRHQDVFSPPGPEAPAPLCVVSALAEGSDTIVAQAALGRVGRMTEEFLAGGSAAMFVDAADYGEINRLFQRSR